MNYSWMVEERGKYPAFLFKLFFSTYRTKTCVGGGRGGALGLMFAGYVPLSFQSPYPIVVYFFSNYTLHLSHSLENVIFAIPT